MFHFKTPTRPDRPVLTDPVQAELDRRILFASPSPLKGPIPTYAQIRAELDRFEVVSRRAVASIQAGPVPPALAALAHLLASDFECVEVDSQQPPEDAEAGDLRAADEVCPGAENHRNRIKLKSYGLKPAYAVEKASVDADPATENALYFPSLGTVPVKTSAHSERQRAHKNDVPWSKKRFIQGHKVSKTLSSQEREWIDDALLRLKVLLKKGVLVCIT